MKLTAFIRSRRAKGEVDSACLPGDDHDDFRARQKHAPLDVRRPAQSAPKGESLQSLLGRAESLGWPRHALARAYEGARRAGYSHEQIVAHAARFSHEQVVAHASQSRGAHDFDAFQEAFKEASARLRRAATRSTAEPKPKKKEKIMSIAKLEKKIAKRARKAEEARAEGGAAAVAIDAIANGARSTGVSHATFAQGMQATMRENAAREERQRAGSTQGDRDKIARSLGYANEAALHAAHAESKAIGEVRTGVDGRKYRTVGGMTIVEGERR